MEKIDVSVIIPVYNSEDWIEECLDSIIPQMLDLQLEIILVDDGSSDRSLHKIEKYLIGHRNISLYSQTHGKQGKARNTGLSKARGTYIVFLDADDLLYPGALKRFHSQAVHDQSDFVVGIAQSFNGKKKWINEGYSGYRRLISNTNIDRFPGLLLDPSACNKMYKASFIEENKLRFPENTYCEDVGFIYRAYLVAQNIMILPEILHRYRARSRKAVRSGTQTFDEVRLAQCAEIYSACLDQYQASGTQANSELLQARAVVRMKRFFNKIPAYPDANSFLYPALQTFLDGIDPRILVEHADRFAIPFLIIRQGFFFHAVACLNRPDNKAALADFFKALSATNHALAFLFFKQCILYKEELQKATFTQSKKNILKRLLELSRMAMALSNREQQSNNSNPLGLYSLRNALWGCGLWVWSRIARKYLSKKEWLIGERYGTSAEESGHAFFQYCQGQKNASHVYYVIEKSVLGVGDGYLEKNYLIKGSFRHLYHLGRTNTIFFTNDIWDVCPRMPFLLVPMIRKVFLTHGVKLYGPGVYMRDKADAFDCILVSSSLEKQIIQNEWNIRKSSKILVTGLPRFDSILSSEPKNEILFFTTWRKRLRTKTDRQFKETLFFEMVSSLLGHTGLLPFLRENELVLVFRSHFNVAKRLNSFNDFACDHVRIENHTGSKNLQQAIKDATLLITDYSSILWDMAYLHRPVILYQFDREAFMAERGLHAFGVDESSLQFARVARNADQILVHLKDFAAKEFFLNHEEAGNADSFFAYQDTRNCERLYGALTFRK
jgi:CDP-ribitol ribitolphosphotransferase / teichoic acid ribitol-phosphate polymerase